MTRDEWLAKEKERRARVWAAVQKLMPDLARSMTDDAKTETPLFRGASIKVRPLQGEWIQ